MKIERKITKSLNYNLVQIVKLSRLCTTSDAYNHILSIRLCKTKLYTENKSETLIIFFNINKKKY